MGEISLRDKRILVTGGNGYLGTNLVKALRDKGAKVFVVDQKSTGIDNEFCVDIARRDEVMAVINEVRPQIVYHLAALLHRDRDFTNHQAIVDVNYGGTMNLLLALKAAACCDNFIFTSTSEIYGGNPSPFSEEMLPMPVSPYSMTKAFAELAIKAFADVNYTILRLFNFYGPGMPQSFFIPQMIHSLKNEPSFKMTHGEQARDFLYIDDIIQAMLLAATNEKAKNETFNVCSGKSVTLKDFVIGCKEALGSKCQIEFGALPYRNNEVWDMVGNNMKIRVKLGFEPRYDIKIVCDKM